MEKMEDADKVVKSETTPAAYARPKVPEKSRAGKTTKAVAIVGVTGFALLLWSHTLIGVIVGALGIVSGAVFLVARRLARKGLSASSGLPPGVSEEEFRSLKKDINRLRFEEGVERHGERAHDQLLQSAERFKRFTALLSEKFNKGEITHSRYHTAGTQAYLSILDNLRAVASILGAAGAIKADYAEKRLKIAKSDETPELESQALEERLRNKERQLARVQDILSANETALTAFDSINEAISSVKTSSGWSGMEMEEALKELERLAERAPKYSIQTSGDI